MIRTSRTASILAMLVLLLASAVVPIKWAKAQQNASAQDKMNACSSLADKKGLKGDDRKSFMQDCLSKASGKQPVSEMSNKDKVSTCKDLADKRNLSGSDRRSFIKSCMEKANSK